MQNSKIGILGLGITGLSAFEYLLNKKNTIICYDDNLLTRENFNKKYGSGYIFDPTSPVWKTINNLLVSPGISPNHPLITIASENNIKIISDIELFFRDVNANNIIGITGTNGKSTTTALIYHILKSANLNYVMGGNIGKAILSLPKNADGYILELSSFQLDLLNELSLSIAVILNITNDHLDRYLKMENYIHSKTKILELLKDDGVGIINVDQDVTRNIFNKYPNKNIYTISTKKIVKKGVTILNNKLYDNSDEAQMIIELPENKFLLGEHNAQNIATSYLVCKNLKLPIEYIINGIKSFTGLEHRMQYLGKWKNIHFYNDSKATNGDATVKSIKSLDNIYWLAGGIAKADGINQVIPYAKHINKAYFFGKDKLLFAETAMSCINYSLFDNLAVAFNQAVKDASSNEKESNILLAPAAASKDQFKNFEERGNLFITLYNQLIL